MTEKGTKGARAPYAVGSPAVLPTDAETLTHPTHSLTTSTTSSS